ncbi:MAG: reverse transcriptase family protein, partial [Flavobacteriaceae bacterium]|nr:reverse transcriptase family protein [Flavobacteriaceae bacterium]
CDYKIAAKAIANRLKNVLPTLINHDQTGFLKGRFIGENIRLIDSIICHARENNIPGLILFLDFEKAFDTIEWSFIRDTLKYFGFGIGIIKWMNLFYGRPESYILNNGWASDFFGIRRGVRQGCPLSPYLFVLAAEVLAKPCGKTKIEVSTSTKKKLSSVNMQTIQPLY